MRSKFASNILANLCSINTVVSSSAKETVNRYIKNPRSSYDLKVKSVFMLGFLPFKVLRQGSNRVAVHLPLMLEN